MPYLNLPGRHPDLPRILIVKQHPLVSKPHGKIVILVGSKTKEALAAQLKVAANMALPNGIEGAKNKGFLVLNPENRDIILFRDVDGSGKAEDDLIKSWTASRQDYTPEEIASFQSVQAQILGESTKIGKSKAILNKSTGEWEGGIAFERHDRARNLESGPRCYPLSTSFQVPRGMDAPSVGRKVYGRSLDAHGILTKEILRIGGIASMRGLSRGPEGLEELLTEQVDYRNIPHVGTGENVGFPAFQLNIASAVEHEIDQNLTSSLGRFGGAHIDSGDAAGAPTSMTVLGRNHADVENDLFYILDLGIAWKLHEFSTLYFSGLHFHGGNQPYYKKGPRTDLSTYIRATLIGYAPVVAYEGASSMAFAALPGRKESGEDRVLKVATEMRDAASHLLCNRAYCGQATYTTDGGAIMDSKSHFNHFVRNMTMFTAHIVHQLPPEYLGRFDKEKFMSSFSFVHETIQTGADDWSLGPGWSGEDTTIGKQYSADDNPSTLSAADLAKLYNSDSKSESPYGNDEILKVTQRWERHSKLWASTVPVCSGAGDLLSDQQIIGGRPQTRKAVTRNSRQDATKSTAAKKKSGKRKKQKDSAPANEDDSDGNESSAPLAIKRKTLASSDSGDDSNERETEPSSKRLQTNERAPNSDSERNDSPEYISPGKRKRNCIAHIDGPSTAGSHHRESKRLKLLKAAKLIGAHEENLEVELDNLEDSEREELTITPTQPLKSFSIYSQSLSIKNLQRSMEMLSNEAAQIEDTDISTSFVNQSKEIIECLSNPNEGSDLCHIWRICDNLISNRNSTSIRMRFQQREIMIVTLLTWEWLDYTVLEGYKSYIAGETHYLSKLFHTVSLIFDTSTTDRELDAAAFLAGFKPGETIFAYHSNGNNQYKSHSQDEYVQQATEILEHWYRFPQDTSSRNQASFVRALIDNIGYNILFLDSTWEAFSNIRGMLFNNQGVRIRSKKQMQRWRSNELETWEIVKPDSEECNMLKSIRNAIEPFSGGGDLLLEKSSNLYLHEANQIELEDVNTNTNGGIIPDEIVFNNLIRQIEMLYPLLDHPDIPFVLPKKKKSPEYRIGYFVQHVHKLSDKQLPFRDFARSRRRILSAGGPFSPLHLGTISGLFSALVYRGITHNTDFLNQQRTLFTDFNDYDTLRLSLDQSKEYFCNKTAYGSATGRTVENAKIYWDAVQRTEFTSWLIDTEPIQFIDLFHLFATSKLKGNKAFPGFGSLTAYLLASDYAIAGKATVPTSREMGIIIFQINAGGLTGLRSMGFKCINDIETGEAFKTVYEALVTNIDRERQLQMKFSVFLVEHMLCKIRRLDTCLFAKACT